MEYVKTIDCGYIVYRFIKPYDGSHSEIKGICYCNEGYSYLLLKNGKFGIGRGDILSSCCKVIIKEFETFNEARDYRTELRHDRCGFEPVFYNF